MTEIGDNAFRNCISLESVTIPDSIALIGSWVFNDCTSLKNVTINSDNINNIEKLGIPKLAVIKCNPDSITDRTFKAMGYKTQSILTPLQAALSEAFNILSNNNLAEANLDEVIEK